jgi:hypothetical protein
MNPTSRPSRWAALAVLLLSGAAAAGFEPIKPQPAPGDLPDFQQAEDLFKGSMGKISGDAQLGFHYYLRAVQGYRLAQYWAKQGRPNHPDAANGYAAARRDLAKAEATLVKEKAACVSKGNAECVKFCEKMLGFVQNLRAKVKAETGT